MMLLVVCHLFREFDRQFEDKLRRDSSHSMFHYFWFTTQNIACLRLYECIPGESAAIVQADRILARKFFEFSTFSNSLGIRLIYKLFITPPLISTSQGVLS